MKKYRIEFEKTETGYIEIFADNKDDAIKRQIKQPSYNEVIETSDYDFTNVKLIN